MEGNLLANCVRESGDHGPFNSWDRVPYITELGMVRDPSAPKGAHATTAAGDLSQPPGHTLANATHPSVTPLFRQVRNNFILGTYKTLFTLDTDDGSGFIQAYDNFMIYGGGGLKVFFGGRWQHHFRNVYAYVGDCYWTGPDTAFYENYCVGEYMTRPDLKVDAQGCPTDYAFLSMTLYNNTILTPNGTEPVCNGTALPFPTDDELLSHGLAATAPYPRASLV